MLMAPSRHTPRRDVDVGAVSMRRPIVHHGVAYEPSTDAVNFLDAAVYWHHPVLRRVPLRVYPIERDQCAKSPPSP
jgi:hypothetical protein